MGAFHRQIKKKPDRIGINWCFYPFPLILSQRAVTCTIFIITIMKYVIYIEEKGAVDFSWILKWKCVYKGNRGQYEGSLAKATMSTFYVRKANLFGEQI